MRGLSTFDESLDPTFGVVIDAFRPSGVPPTFLFMEPLSFSGKLRGPWDGYAVLAYLPSASMAGVGACPQGPSCMEAPGTHPWRPVARESWHQLVECAWGCDSAFGFEALFLLCFVYSKLAFEICFHASHPREGNLFGDNAQKFSQPLK